MGSSFSHLRPSARSNMPSGSPTGNRVITQPISPTEDPDFKRRQKAAELEATTAAEMAKEAKQRSKAQKAAAVAIAEIQTSLDQLAKLGSAVRTGGEWYKNFPRFLSATPPGQLLGQAVGSKSQKERDDIASARRMLMSSISGMTGMSAKQIDSNAELKSLLDSLIDPTASYESQKTSVDTLSNMYELNPFVQQQIKARTQGGGRAQRSLDDILSQYGVQ
jgi:hypothetical protein